MLRVWLHGRSRHTVRAYETDARAFLAHADKPLRAITVGDVQAFGDSMTGLFSASRARKLSAVKSLLSYAHRLGHVAFRACKSLSIVPIWSG
jgi:site-specific recombinase XerD